MKKLYLTLAALLALMTLALAQQVFEDADSGATPGQKIGSVVVKWLNGAGKAIGASAVNPLPVGVIGKTYTLASAVGSSGATSAVSGIVGAAYVYSCTAGTWNSATAQLQWLGPDGSTWISPIKADGTTAGPLSANGSQPIILGQGASARVNVTGTPTNLNCNLS